MPDLWCTKCHAVLTSKTRKPNSSICRECHREYEQTRPGKRQKMDRRNAKRRTPEGREKRRKERARTQELADYRAEVVAKIAEMTSTHPSNV